MTTIADSDRRERHARHLATYPRTPIPAKACALRELSTAHHNGLVPAVGEITDVPGVLVTPFAHGNPVRYTGAWCLTHAATGLKLSAPASHLHIREAVEWLRRAGLDWDRPVDVLLADAELEAAYAALYFELWEARQERRPLLVARTSWVDWPPLWRIRYRGMVSTDGFGTWDDAAYLVYSAHRAPDVALPLHPDAEIVRDATSPGWALRCASIACADDSWLVDWCTEGDWHALGTRAELTDLAIEDGWRAHPGEYWTCPDCTRCYQQGQHG
jgi:hypothetical protein